MWCALREARGAGNLILASEIPVNCGVFEEFARLVPVGSMAKLRDAIELEWQRERTPKEVERQISLCKSRHDWGVIARAMVPLFAFPCNRDLGVELRSRPPDAPTSCQKGL